MNASITVPSTVVTTLCVHFGHVLASGYHTYSTLVCIHRMSDGSFERRGDNDIVGESVDFSPAEIVLFEALTSSAYQTGKAFLAAGGSFPVGGEPGKYGFHA